jgi:hypothetical protein
VQKISCPPGFDPRTVQPEASCCTNYTIQAHAVVGCMLQMWSSVVPGAQREPTVTTGFSRFQLNVGNSSNQCIFARSNVPSFFTHEPTPPTSATQIASTGRIVKAAVSVICLQFQNKAQFLLYFLNLVQHRSLPSPFKVEMEKKRGVQCTDTARN